jgi:pimeloyl-ACP methyl ester carboxylesterase
MNPPESTVELVRTETADGLFLDGALWQPRQAGGLPVDAFLLIHGTGSNFYSPGILETFSRQALADGLAVLRINTRGHDGMCSIPSRKGSEKGGATYERISDCALDIAAWATWLTSRGFPRIVLAGHSMGGVKAVYSQAFVPHPDIRAIVGISPPRFSYRRMLAHPRGDRFREEFNWAYELSQSSDAEQLMHVTQPLPFVATPVGYVEKYGPEDRYDYVPLLSRLTCPTLILVGTESVRTSPAFGGLDEALAEVAASHPAIACELVAGANINYSGCDDVPYARATAWLKTRLPAMT